MAVTPVITDVELGQDHLIDILVLQWWTALEDGPRCFGVLPQRLVEGKRRELDWLATWLSEQFDPNTPSRPLFIVAPEVSLPNSLLSRVEDMIASLRRPCVLIAGLSHLTWSQYSQLLADCRNMPVQVDWLTGDNAGGMVNAAAILVRSGAAGSPVLKFLQPKLHPFREENPQLFRGLHTLLFRSRNQTSGSRLNFAVKICSDFVDPEMVRNFRREMETATPGSQIDFTFVPQWQVNPEDTQFKQGIQAYFETPIEMAETSKSAVIFANTARECRGRSREFGGSRVNVKQVEHFPMARNTPSPTCVRSDWKMFDHQALVLRDSGPCVYHLTMKPVYLVNRVAGSGDEQPFQRCECAFLDGAQTRLSFRPLHPICHWLDSEWRDDEHDLIETIEWAKHDGDAATIYRTFVQEAHRRTREMWIAAMGTREPEVRDGMQTYTDVMSVQENSPGKQGEPWYWSDTISTAARRFMRVLCLLRVGLPETVELLFPPRLNIRHAMLGEAVALTLLWGNGDRAPIDILNRFRKRHQQYGIGEFTGRKWLVVLVDSACPLTADDLMEWKKSDITQASITDATGNLIPAVGDIARVDQDLQPICINEILSTLLRSRDSESLQSGLRAIMQPVLV
jgi:hypothetical protein